MVAEKAILACLLLAAHTYEVPPAVMVGIRHVEGGYVGAQIGPNRNGTYDLGIMQVNTLWIPALARAWQVDHKTAHQLVRDDACVNMRVSAWILKQKIREARGSLYGGIAYYHSSTPGIGARYASKVLTVLANKGLLKRDYAKPDQRAYYASADSLPQPQQGREDVRQ